MAWNSNFQLRIVKGNQESLVISLVEQVYVLGRAQRLGESAPGHLFFFEPTVSRTHAELRWNDKKKHYTLSHRSNTNPTLVEGTPVGKREARILAPGNEIRMGHLVLNFEQQAPVVEKKPAAAGLSSGVHKTPAAAAAPPRESGTHQLGGLGGLGNRESRESREPGVAVDSILAALGSMGDGSAAPKPQAPRNTASRDHGGALDWRRPSSGSNPSVQHFVKAPPTNQVDDDNEDFLERPFDSPENTPLGFRLVVSDGPDVGRVFPVNEAVVIIGKSKSPTSECPSGTVLLNDNSLALEVALLSWQGRGGHYTILEAEHNTQPLFVRRVVSGRRAEYQVSPDRPLALEEGDVLELGQSKLVLRRMEAGAASKRTADLGDAGRADRQTGRGLQAEPQRPPLPRAPRGDRDSDEVGPPRGAFGKPAARVERDSDEVGPPRGAFGKPAARVERDSDEIGLPRGVFGKAAGRDERDFDGGGPSRGFGDATPPKRSISLSDSIVAPAASATSGGSSGSNSGVQDWRRSSLPGSKVGLPSTTSKAVEHFATSEHPTGRFRLDSFEDMPSAEDQEPAGSGFFDPRQESNDESVAGAPTIRSLRLQGELDAPAAGKGIFGKAIQATAKADAEPVNFQRPSDRSPVSFGGSSNEGFPRAGGSGTFERDIVPSRKREEPSHEFPSSEKREPKPGISPVFISKNRNQNPPPQLDHSDVPTSIGNTPAWAGPPVDDDGPATTPTIMFSNQKPGPPRDLEFPSFVSSAGKPEAEPESSSGGVSEGKANQRKMVADIAPLAWPWKKHSDYIFDFVAGPSQGCQLPFSQAELTDDRAITLGNLPGKSFDLPVEGEQPLSAILRYRSGRFGLMNEGTDDSVSVNKFPLKKGDQVVLSTGDKVEIGTTTFRFLERRVVDLLQGFQVAVESGVDEDQDKAFPFYKQRLLIGRGKQCDIRLNDLEVSRIHVAVVHREGKFFIQHRSETNPTFLNGVSLLQGGERMIKPGDRVRLSSITLLQFEYSEAKRSPIGPPRLP